MSHRDLLHQLSKDELIDLLEDAAKNWLAHDGLWFLAAEDAFDIETAIRLDKSAWEQFTIIETVMKAVAQTNYADTENIGIGPAFQVILVGQYRSSLRGRGNAPVSFAVRIEHRGRSGPRRRRAADVLLPSQ